MKTRALLISAALALPLPVAAQENDPGFVGGLIQDSLSGPGRDVRVEGFRGALSGRATIDRLTFADDDGVWLTLENAVLDWSRAALLRRRLTVQELSAERLTVTRRPIPTESAAPEAPTAEASGFALPELPVAVRIDSVAIDRIELSEPVLGEAATLTLDGRATIVDGEADIAFDTTRLDGPEDRIGLSATFSNESRVLSVDLAVEEQAGGLIGTLAQLPGAPSLDLAIAGTGPLENFGATIRLASDGQERLTGEVKLLGTDDGGTRFEAGLGGDVTALLVPEYQPFFGPDVGLALAGTRGGDGSFEIGTFEVSARSLDLTGRAQIDAAGVPQLVVLNGDLADPRGERVRLPGSEITLDRAQLSISLNAAQGDFWTADVTARGTDFGAGRADLLRLAGQGTLRDGADGVSVTADIGYEVGGLASSEGVLETALGRDLTGGAVLSWQSGAPLEVSSLSVGGDDYGLDAIASLVFEGRSVRVDGEAQVAAADLSRFSGLAGRPLTGSAQVGVSGTADVLGGIFDAVASVRAEGLSVGQDIADRMLDGPVAIDLVAARDQSGTRLDRLDLQSRGLTMTGAGSLGPVGSAMDITATLTDIGLIAPQYTGSVTLRGRVEEPSEDSYDIDVQVDGPYSLAGGLSGRWAKAATALNLDVTLPDIAPLVPEYTGAVRITGTATSATGSDALTVDLDVTAPYDSTVALEGLLGAGVSDLRLAVRVPDLAAFAEAVPGALSLDGTASETADGQWAVDLIGAGPFDADLSVTGTVGDGRSAVRIAADLPDLGAVVPSVPGPVTLGATATESVNGSWAVDADLAGPHSATLSLDGIVGGGVSALDLAAVVPDVSRFAPGISGALNVEGAAAEAEPGRWTVDLDVEGPYASDLALTGVVGGGESALRLEGGVPDIAPLAPGFTGALAVNGTARETGDGQWQVALEADAPYGGDARINGAVGDGRSAVRFTAGLPDLAAVVPGVPGAVRLSGRLDEAGGGLWRVAADASGPYRAQANVSGTVGGGATEVTAVASAPDLSAVAPSLRGAARVEARARQEGDAWLVNADGRGPFSSTVSATARVLAGETAATVSARLPDIGPLAPGLSGPVTLEAQANQDGEEAWRVSADAGLPYSGTASVQGRLQPGSGNFDVALDLPSIAPLAPGLSGPLSVSGTAREDASGWTVDLGARGPAGSEAQVAGTLAPDLSTAALRAQGSAPLGLANRALSPRQIEGTLRFDLGVNGPLALGSVTGTVSTSGARLTLPTLSQTLQDIDVTAALTGGSVNLTVGASGGSGGRVTVSGPIDLSGGLNADLRVLIDGFVLEDPTLYRTTLGGDVRINGALTQGGAISGRVVIGATEIQIPSGGLGFGGAVPKMTHLNEPSSVFLTRQRAGAVEDESKSGNTGGGGPVFSLDLRIDAPNQIFIRGRGLDIELGGGLALRGTTAAPIAVGGIEVIRGRLSILGKRLEFSRDGSVTLSGDLVPFLDLAAVTETGDYTIVIQITGPVDDPEFTFSSEPSLPEDEVIAVLLFGKGLGSLSAFQAAQLAASVAELSGRGGGGLLGGFREGLGLDELDVRTNEDGETEVNVGKYLTDNIYTDVTTTGDGESRIGINIDLTDDITVTGSATSDGESTLGIFFQRDY